MPAIFHDQAKAELEETVAWYEQRRAGLGREFRLAVENVLRRICENPKAGSQYGRTRFRYVLVRRFPYVVFYCENEQLVRVMAVAHGRRRRKRQPHP
jgi:plasmid stabilization system protein ParE